MNSINIKSIETALRKHGIRFDERYIGNTALFFCDTPGKNSFTVTLYPNGKARAQKFLMETDGLDGGIIEKLTTRVSDAFPVSFKTAETSELFCYFDEQPTDNEYPFFEAHLFSFFRALSDFGMGFENAFAAEDSVE